MAHWKWLVAAGLIAVFAIALFWRDDVNAFSGFDFSNPRVDREKILRGGPPKDGIPAIDRPDFANVKEAGDFMKDSDRVMAFTMDGVSRAYPVKILNWHEMVNDNVKGRPVMITFCPLCGTGMMFDRRINGKEHTFGVSGLLYESDMLFYDHQTDSLWSQIEGMAITGKRSGTVLKMLPILNTTWGRWKKEHPGTQVLTPNTGYSRSYDVNPYGGYAKRSGLMFPISKSDERFPLKDTVIGVRVGGKARAYFFNDLARLDTPLQDTLGGETITVHFDAETSTAWITDTKEKLIPSVVGFWFAWYTFNADTSIHGHD